MNQYLANLNDGGKNDIETVGGKNDIQLCRQDGHADLPEIKVNQNITYQKTDGIRACFNEAGMICLSSLSNTDRSNVLRSLFDTISGAGFSLMKSPIAACDVSCAGPWYTYNHTLDDTLMNKFSIERDLGINGLIPYIKTSIQLGNFIIQAPLDFAPDWMYSSLKAKNQT